ncbi:MAG: S8 family serine peptidase [Clostridia bacterium]|nr:S8 family serine peptidase [Clostridia bacterium]
MKKALSLILAFALLLCAFPFAASANEAPAEAPVELIEGTYVPGQVVVLFKNGAIDSGASPKKGGLSALGADFGRIMDASCSEDKAYSAAYDEIAIIGANLGDGFVLEDTLVFNDGAAKRGSKKGTPSYAASGKDFSIALVSSDKYDTATMIAMLSKDENVLAVEPNYRVKKESYADYSLNDPLNSYLFNVNSPAAQNVDGKNTDGRGAEAEAAFSINAASGWAKLTGEEDEVVVAVIDSGVFCDHEDLADMMWTNPGNIGLKGEHGFDFCNNDDDPVDDDDHGSHCSGTIAAQANNAKGVAGVASKANVKIMAIKILGGDGYSGGSLFDTYGAYNYVYKAVLGGVNVVAINDSWGGSYYGTIYDYLIDLLGEEGVISYIAAGNEGVDNDRLYDYPSNSNSEYAVSVGAADINGTPTPFSCYGKKSVDVFGPGQNILSSVAADVYFPDLYDEELFNDTTEYYGVFNADTVVKDGTITPSVGSKAGDGVKAFGDLVFVKQRFRSLDDDYEISDDAYLELSVESGRYFNADNPYSLKITVKNAQPGEGYYIYFPYEKNSLTTGGDNTYFSITTECIASEDGYVGCYLGGDVHRADDGLLSIDCGFYVSKTGEDYDGMVWHTSSYGQGDAFLLSADATAETEYGFGFYTYGEDVDDETEGEAHDISMYVHSFAISKPDIELVPGTSYDLMSGTSQATPAVCGAGALLAALNPRQEGESGGDYARRIRSKLFSCVRRTDELKDLCSTGGYVDLSLIDEAVPAISDAYCDLDNETLTLIGANLFEGCAVTYKRIAVDGAEETALPEDMPVEYFEDGSKLVISNAKSFFSTLTEFVVTGANGLSGEASFFLVRGQKEFELVGTDITIKGEPIPYLLTDADGENLYGYYLYTDEVGYFNGEYFITYKRTVMVDEFKEWLIANGADRFSVYNDYEIYAAKRDIPLCENGVIYVIVDACYEEYDEEEDEYYYPDHMYLATFDLNSETHRWNFAPMADLPDAFYDEVSFSFTPGIYNGKLYCIATDTSEEATEDSLPMYSYDPAADTWTKEADLPASIYEFTFMQSNGKLYAMFGFYTDDSLSMEESVASGVYCFDGEKWEQKRDDLKYVGRLNDFDGYLYHSDAKTCVKNGLLFINASVDGGGNAFVYNTETDEIEPLYYTGFNGISDSYDQDNSCVATRDGVYYIRRCIEDSLEGWKLFMLPADSGVYEDPYKEDVILGDLDGDGEITVSDALAALRIAAKLAPETPEALAAGDVDGDGTITVGDALQILRVAAKLADSL